MEWSSSQDFLRIKASCQSLVQKRLKMSNLYKKTHNKMNNENTWRRHTVLLRSLSLSPSTDLLLLESAVVETLLNVYITSQAESSSRCSSLWWNARLKTEMLIFSCAIGFSRPRNISLKVWTCNVLSSVNHRPEGTGVIITYKTTQWPRWLTSASVMYFYRYLADLQHSPFY